MADQVISEGIGRRGIEGREKRAPITLILERCRFLKMLPGPGQPGLINAGLQLLPLQFQADRQGQLEQVVTRRLEPIHNVNRFHKERSAFGPARDIVGAVKWIYD